MNENLKPVEKLTPFTKMIMTIGTLPSSFYASMSYYESMVWLYEYLKNEIIPAVNNNAEAVEELQQKYIEFTGDITEEIGDFKEYINGKVEELETYMNNYFDNLDVQQEINNKLDAMALDGTLTDLIKAYVDPIYEAYEERIDESISSQNTEISTFKSSVNNSLASMNSEITSLSSGSPAGVYATTTALTTADPDHSKIYVVEEDGKWYYYNTSTTSWTAGGTYQSTGVGDNEVDSNNLVENLQYSLNTEEPTLTFNSGHYITSGGVIGDSNNFYISSAIHLNVGDVLEFAATGYETAVAMLSTILYDYSDRYQVIISSADSNEHVFTHTAQYEADYYISSHYEPSDVKVYRKNVCSKDSKNSYTNKEYIDNVIFNKTTDESFTTSKYLNSLGNLYDSNNHAVTDYIEILPNEYITLKINGTLLQQSGDSVYCCEYDKDNTFITSHAYGSESYIKFLSNSESAYIRLTITPYLKRSGYNLYYSSLTKQLDNLRNGINDKKGAGNILRMFSNITCIGDSLTESLVYTGASSFRQAYKSYPSILGVMTGASITNLSHGGDSATTSWNRWNESITSKTNQLTIIYLGTNDGLTDSVDTDCVGNDYTQYANTNTGNYGKIIKKSLDAGSKVILVKCYAPSSSITTINTAIESLAERFNVAVVPNAKLTDNIYHYWPDLQGTNSTHYNDLGYEVFTEQLVNNVDNMTDTMKSRILPV